MNPKKRTAIDRVQKLTEDYINETYSPFLKTDSDSYLNSAREFIAQTRDFIDEISEAMGVLEELDFDEE